MPDLKTITLPNNTTYDLRDSRVDSLVSQATKWIGNTTTPISDGSTTNPITIDGESVTAENGNIVAYNDGTKSMEYIWNGELSTPKWQEFGSTGSLKALAFKDTVAVSTQVPATYETVFTGKQATIQVSGTTTGSVSETKGAVEIKTKSSGTNKYTPAGSVSAPTISVSSAGATSTVKEPSFTVANENLTITLTDKTFKTGDASYSASAPSFTGTDAYLETASQVLTGASFSGDTMNASGTYTPEATSVVTETKTNASVAGTVTYTP